MGVLRHVRYGMEGLRSYRVNSQYNLHIRVVIRVVVNTLVITIIINIRIW